MPLKKALIYGRFEQRLQDSLAILYFKAIKRLVTILE